MKILKLLFWLFLASMPGSTTCPRGQGLGLDTQVDLGHVALGLLRPCTAPGHPARTPGGNKDKQE